MKIGVLAQKSGISRDAIRLYENKGLLKGVTRPHLMNNYKDYPEENFDRIKIIKFLKQYGFTLQECGSMLEVLYTTDTKCSEVQKLIAQKINQVDQKLSELSKLKKMLYNALNGKNFKIALETTKA